MIWFIFTCLQGIILVAKAMSIGMQPPRRDERQVQPTQRTAPSILYFKSNYVC